MHHRATYAAAAPPPSSKNGTSGKASKGKTGRFNRLASAVKEMAKDPAQVVLASSPIRKALTLFSFQAYTATGLPAGSRVIWMHVACGSIIAGALWFAVARLAVRSFVHGNRWTDMELIKSMQADTARTSLLVSRLGPMRRWAPAMRAGVNRAIREGFARSRSFQRRIFASSGAMRLGSAPVAHAARSADPRALLDAGLVLESLKTLELERALETTPRSMALALAAAVATEAQEALRLLQRQARPAGGDATPGRTDAAGGSTGDVESHGGR